MMCAHFGTLLFFHGIYPKDHYQFMVLHRFHVSSLNDGHLGDVSNLLLFSNNVSMALCTCCFVFVEVYLQGKIVDYWVTRQVRIQFSPILPFLAILYCTQPRMYEQDYFSYSLTNRLYCGAFGVLQI